MKRPVSVLVLATLVLAACGGDDDDDSASTAGSETAATESADTETAGTEAASTSAGSAGTEAAGTDAAGELFVIGAAVAQTGGFELYDNEVLAGVRRGIEEVNAAGGAGGRMLELIISDHGTDVARVESAALDVIEQGAELVVVTADYDFGAQAGIAAGNAGVLAMGGAGAAEFGFEGIGPLFFNVYPGNPTEAAVITEWAYNTQGWRNPILLADTSIEYSKEVCELFDARWTELAGADSIVGRETFVNSDPSIAAQVSAIRDSEADVLVLCSYPPGGASAIRQIRTGGIDLPIQGVAAYDGTFWLEAIPDLSDFYHPAMASAAGDDANPDVNALFAAVPPAGGGIYVLFGYLIVETLARALEITNGSGNGEELASAIETFADEPLLVGPTTYSDTCHVPIGRQMAMMEIQNGAPSLIEYITPESLPVNTC